MTAGLENYGLSYQGPTIVYLSETSLRHYYKIVDRDKFNQVKDNITFDSDTPVNYTVKNNMIYFEKKNIAPVDMDTPYILKIGTTEYQYSVLNYIKACLESDKTSDNMKELVKATYLYHVAAKDYFLG